MPVLAVWIFQKVERSPEVFPADALHGGGKGDRGKRGAGSFQDPSGHEHCLGCFLQRKEHQCPEVLLPGRGPREPEERSTGTQGSLPRRLQGGGFWKSCLQGFSIAIALKFVFSKSQPIWPAGVGGGGGGCVCVQGLMIFVIPSLFCLHKPLPPYKILKNTFYNCIGRKTNIIQVGLY